MPRIAAQRLSDAYVKSCQPPAQGEAEITFADVPGLELRLYASGVKTFRFRYTWHGKRRRLRIGNYPAWTPTMAKQEAARLRRMVDAGEDPRASKATDKPLTLAEFAEQFKQEHLSRKADAKRSWALIRREILPPLGHMPVGEIRRPDAVRLHAAISRTRPVRANRALAALSTIMSHAVTLELRADNPCRGVARNPEQGRQRYLTPDEIERLSAALAAYPGRSHADCIRFLLLTGARRGEAINATWDQFDLVRGIWTKPSAHTKQRREHRVPLSQAAVELLRARQGDSEGAYVFPGRWRGKPIGQLHHAWETLRREAGLQDVRIHDLRHTYASLLASGNVALPIIGQLLGHTRPQTTARYTHLFDDALREATEQVGALVAPST
jgi:integrase